MINVIDTFNKSRRALSRSESSSIKALFPNAEPHKIEFLSESTLPLRASDDLCPKVLEEDLEDDVHPLFFDCISHVKFTEIYNATSGEHLERIKNEAISRDLCSMSKYKCETIHSFEVKYNCIGFAIGVIKWVDTSRINHHILNGKNPLEAIDAHIVSTRTEYDSSHANLFNILDSPYTISHELNETNLLNNTMAFYFKNGFCQHATRYITDFNSWVSKLGKWIVISHTLEDLVGDAYGDTIYYLITEGGKISGEIQSNEGEL